MICTCKGKLKFVRSVNATPECRVLEQLCLACGRKVTTVEFIAYEANRYGKGAAALAAKIRNGSKIPKILTRL